MQTEVKSELYWPRNCKNTEIFGAIAIQIHHNHHYKTLLQHLLGNLLLTKSLKNTSSTPHQLFCWEEVHYHQLRLEFVKNLLQHLVQLCYIWWIQSINLGHLTTQGANTVSLINTVTVASSRKTIGRSLGDFRWQLCSSCIITFGRILVRLVDTLKQLWSSHHTRCKYSSCDQSWDHCKF